MQNHISVGNQEKSLEEKFRSVVKDANDDRIVEKIEKLITEDGLDINKAFSAGDQLFPVEFVVLNWRRGSIDPLEYLIQKGANINTPRIIECAFLTESFSSDFFDYLSTHYKNLFIENEVSELHIAVFRGDLETVKVLLESEDSKKNNTYNKNGLNLLAIAAVGNCFEKELPKLKMFKYLIENNILNFNTELFGENHPRRGATVGWQIHYFVKNFSWYISNEYLRLMDEYAEDLNLYTSPSSGKEEGVNLISLLLWDQRNSLNLLNLNLPYIQYQTSPCHPGITFNHQWMVKSNEKTRGYGRCNAS